MDIERMLADLRAEREVIEEAILALERLARGTAARRGRPPKWLAEMKAAEEGPKRRGRPRKMPEPAQ